MKIRIEQLNNELSQIDKRKKALQEAIEALQKVCNHKFEPSGHSHKKHEKCSECGLEITS